MAPRKGPVSPSRGSDSGRGKITDSIVENLRQDIVTGRLERGSRLPSEKDLAAHYEVSQPTIREAIRALDVMGLVDVRHGSGAYVSGDGVYLVASALQTLLQIENVSLLEVLDVREVLGRESVRSACENATDEDIVLLEQRLEEANTPKRSSSVEEIVDQLAAFQIAVSAATHNPLFSTIEGFLVNLLLQLQARAMRQRGARAWSERSQGFREDRGAIVEAIKRHDPDAGFAAMEAYLEHQRKVFLGDPAFAEMRLADDKAVLAMADLIRESRGGKPR